ncbi:MAG: hypothetical protein ABIH55_00255 [Nanoarchaeota archaeon]|nr:hypothetical protein [Nanoarchaeota archaeon]
MIKNWPFFIIIGILVIALVVTFSLTTCSETTAEKTQQVAEPTKEVVKEPAPTYDSYPCLEEMCRGMVKSRTVRRFSQSFFRKNCFEKGLIENVEDMANLDKKGRHLTELEEGAREALKYMFEGSLEYSSDVFEDLVDGGHEVDVHYLFNLIEKIVEEVEDANDADC